MWLSNMVVKSSELLKIYNLFSFRYHLWEYELRGFYVSNSWYSAYDMVLLGVYEWK